MTKLTKDERINLLKEFDALGATRLRERIRRGMYGREAIKLAEAWLSKDQRSSLRASWIAVAMAAAAIVIAIVSYLFPRVPAPQQPEPAVPPHASAAVPAP
jgi:hypothetical protein